MIITEYIESEDPLSVKLTWEKPDEHSETISAYEILIRTNDGQTWVEDTVNCKADSEPILSSRTCSIPLTVLRDSPYNLVYNDLVVARGRA